MNGFLSSIFFISEIVLFDLHNAPIMVLFPPLTRSLTSPDSLV